MEKPKTIMFLSEMPITNGVIQAQLLPIVFACREKGYKTYLIETVGRFDSQEKDRESVEKKLTERGVRILKIKVQRHTIFPSILYFTSKTCLHIRKIWKENHKSDILIYARNYKFCPVLLINKIFRHIPFIYSPRGAYVAERAYYRKIKDILYGGFLGYFEKKAIEKSQAAIFETARFKSHLEKMYSLRNPNLKVISNYYDASLASDAKNNREAIRKKLGYEKKRVIVYAGTIEVWYDFEKMFNLVSQLKKKDSRVFFQLFTKIDCARDESKGLFENLKKIAARYSFSEGADYAVSSYSPEKRYAYLRACDAGICLTTPQEFKTMMLYLKIVDYIGAGLPIIANSEITKATEIIKSSGIGAIVDYKNWNSSLSKIDIDKLFEKSRFNSNEYKKYSSSAIIPDYLELFDSVFEKLEKK